MGAENHGDRNAEPFRFRSKECSDCVTALHCKAANGCLQFMTPIEYPFHGFVVLSREQAEDLLAMVDPIDGNQGDAARLLGLGE